MTHDVRRILQIGLGPLGLRIVHDLHATGRGTVVAAVDVAPELVGRPLQELVPAVDASVVVAPDVASAVGAPRLDAAIVATSSDLAECADTFRALLRAGIAVVSTCEELVHPWLRHPELAHELDAIAKGSGGRLIGAGVNPGFLMDALPVFLTAACRTVESVECWRIQDASTRRVPFQQKIGAGLDLAEFEQRVQAKTLRHVGLGESIHFIAARLGWELDEWEETIEPVVADRRLGCALGVIEEGRAAGVKQEAVGRRGGADVVRMHFQAAIGQESPHDRVLVAGDPGIDMRIEGGVHGDVATSSLVIHAIDAVRSVPPGLHTMATVPLLHGRGVRAT